MHTESTYTLVTSTQKGGAGKTTVAINTAGALASRGHRVTVVDLDPQGHATEGLGKPDAYDSDSPTLREALLGENLSFEDIALQASRDNIALIPANASFASKPRLEHSLEIDTQATQTAVSALGNLLDTAPAEIAIIDCPPSLGALTDVGLLTAGQMLIPAKASGTSMRALELLLSKKKALESEFDIPRIRPVGVVANEVRQSGVSDNLLLWLDDTFSDSIPVWQLRKRVALERAWLAGCSIYQHDEDCPHAIEIFDSIASTIEGDL